MREVRDEIRAIRDQLDAIAPYPPTGDVSPVVLARHLAVNALRRWSWLDCTLLTDGDRDVRFSRIDAMCADFAAAVALYALADEGTAELGLGISPPLIPERLSGLTPAEASTLIRDLWVDGELGELLWEFVGGEVARQVDGLVARMTKLAEESASSKPPVVCLCGSTRFVDQFNERRKALTEAGEIVLAIEVVTTQDRESDPQHADPVLKARLDQLHLAKIDMAGYVLVVSDETGYFGDSTSNEIAYANAHGKPVRFQHEAAKQRWLASIATEPVSAR